MSEEQTFRMRTIYDDIALGFLSSNDRTIIDNLWELFGVSTEISWIYKRGYGYCHSVQRKIIFGFKNDPTTFEEFYIHSQEEIGKILIDMVEIQIAKNKETSC